MRLLATWLIVYATTTESKVLRYLATYVGYDPRVKADKISRKGA